MQYVGETMQRCNERMNAQNSGTRTPDKTTSYPQLTRHFTCGCCKNASFSVQVEEKMSGNGRKMNGMEDETITLLRKR